MSIQLHNNYVHNSSMFTFVTMSTKRKYEEEPSVHDEPVTRPNPLLLQESLYDTGAWAVQAVDITTDMQHWKEFSHELGYKNVWFSELGHPDPTKRESPMFDGTVTPSSSGLSNAVGICPGIPHGQRFPPIANVHIGKSFYIMMPFKLSDAFMYPLGNYKRQMHPSKNGKTTNHNPQREDQIRLGLKYTMSFNSSAANCAFSVKDPVSNEALRYLGIMEEVIRQTIPAKYKLGVKFSNPENMNFDVKWSPFQEIRENEDKTKIDFTPIHESFKAFQAQQEHKFVPPVMLRLNPYYNAVEGAEPLISVPVEEQHAWEVPGNMFLVVFKMSRFAGKDLTLSVDLHHTIALGPGYHGLPGKDWFDQARDIPIPLTKEELFVRQQHPLRPKGGA